MPAEDAACGMPVSVQVERLRRVLTEQGCDAVTVLEVDLYALTGGDRDAALDALVAGTESPYVLLDGRMVCAGAVDPERVLAELR